MALGWLKMPLETALTIDVNAILVGFEGHKDMLYFIFGKRSTTTPTLVAPSNKGVFKGTPAADAPKLTAAAFDAMFS